MAKKSTSTKGMKINIGISEADRAGIAGGLAKLLATRMHWSAGYASRSTTSRAANPTLLST